MENANKIAQELAKEAKKKGICHEWYTELKTMTDKRQMLDMYVRGIDFCLANDFPSNAYLAKHFGDLMGAFGVYVDAHISKINCRRCVALGSTKASLHITHYNVCEVFVKDQSNAKIEASDHAFVVVDVFDGCCVSVHADDHAKVLVNLYAQATVQEQSRGHGTIKVLHKHRSSY